MSYNKVNDSIFIEGTSEKNIMYEVESISMKSILDKST